MVADNHVHLLRQFDIFSRSVEKLHTVQAAVDFTNLACNLYKLSLVDCIDHPCSGTAGKESVDAGACAQIQHRFAAADDLGQCLAISLLRGLVEQQTLVEFQKAHAGWWKTSAAPWEGSGR